MAVTPSPAKSLILTAAQAEAVYSGMCALNNVGARLDAFRENEFHAREMESGHVVVHKLPPTFAAVSSGPEIYDSQSAFAAAYGLQQG